MFDNLKKGLFYAKMELLYKMGVKDGSIVPFDDKFYEQMSHTYASCIPVSLEIKYLKPLPMELGRCYDRSLKMFFCFDNALLIRGDRKDFEYMYSKEEAGHGWIEIGDYVFDPDFLLRFKKELYYQMYGVTNIKRYTKEDYIKIGGNKQFYENVKNTTLDDFRPGGSKRFDLLTIIPLLIASSKFYGEEYEKALNDYLSSIQYDAEQIFNQLESEARQLFLS